MAKKKAKKTKKGKKSKKKTKKKVMKKYCPMCGSTKIGRKRIGYACARCTSRFPKPAKKKVSLPKKPKYIQ